MKISKYLSVLLFALIVSTLAPIHGAIAESPAVVSALAPIYPAIAQSARVNGDVIVDVEIDKAGQVSSARAVNGHPLLRQVSEETARRWEFVPNTGSEKRTAELTFSFQIVSEKASGLDRSPVFYPPYRVAVKSERIVMTRN